MKLSMAVTADVNIKMTKTVMICFFSFMNSRTKYKTTNHSDVLVRKALKDIQGILLCATEIKQTTRKQNIGTSITDGCGRKDDKRRLKENPEFLPEVYNAKLCLTIQRTKDKIMQVSTAAEL